ncbi:MAG TPA: hypothetical protein VN137_10620 [Sphingomonas sp.]|nr:hypothetical protein [Sphingomonas sp.]
MRGGATLDFVNPNGTQPAYGKNLANGVQLAFDLRNDALTFGIDSASPLAPTTSTRRIGQQPRARLSFTRAR